MSETNRDLYELIGEASALVAATKRQTLPAEEKMPSGGMSESTSAMFAEANGFYAKQAEENRARFGQ